ncbi:von Willebrand domain-containing protein [Phanerochaete sordida]|uniref:von Willebrand domain-containing protein n=1 Tax=Phanerochaete sordida TaxID=48140 RepID=A0A9P3GCD2_9APHY|nr:von Willebrand domain-containing protein [Phanerochaete sordida]
MDLMDNGPASEIRLQLPMCIGQRYGAPPAGMHGAATASPHTRVRFDAHIQMHGAITSVTSPSHAALHAAPHTAHGRASRHRALARLRSPHFLAGDLVLLVAARGLGRPRCVAEHAPRAGSLALQLALVPEFDLAPAARQEFVFVVDRSGSMSGDRIDTARRTLRLLLPTLPSAGTSFNVFSFGSRCDGLWPASRGYANDTLAVARDYVNAMEANYGGTEIGAALLQACSSRDVTKPTTMFVLTDGQVGHSRPSRPYPRLTAPQAHDPDAVFRIVADAVARAAANAPLRVFTLGIGATASSAMCEGIARVGHGTCLMALAAEDIVGKCAALVRAGRSFLLRDVRVDWGLPPGAALTQAPAHIRDLHPGVRLVVFALVEDARAVPVLPKSVTLHATRDGAPLRFAVPVAPVHADEHAVRVVHTLAARRLLTQLEDDRALPEGARRAAAVRLGETYQLAGRYTSFVAVDDDGVRPLPIARPAWAVAAFARREAEKARRARERAARGGDVLDALAGYVDNAVAVGGGFVSGLLRTWFGGAQPAQGSPAPRDEPDADEESVEEGRKPADTDYDSADTYSTMSSLISSSSWTESDDSRPPTPDPETRSPSPDFALDPTRRIPGAYPGDDDGDGPASGPIDDSVQHLLELQTAEGSFEVNDALMQLVGQDILDRDKPAQVDDHLWATAVAVAYCRKRLTGNADLLGCIVEKALEFAIRAGYGDVDFEALVAAAGRLMP